MNSFPRTRIMSHPLSTPSGFTLMELLLVIAILGVLTTMSLALLRSANEQALVSATQARISRIEALLKSELERYEVRRLQISRELLSEYVRENPIPIPPGPNTFVPRAVQLDGLRKRIIQDLINVELPRPVLNTATQTFERNPDLGRFPSEVPTIGSGQGFWQWLEINYQKAAPSNGYLLHQFLRTVPLPTGAVSNWAEPIFQDHRFNLPAEYLYQILINIDSDGVPAVETLGSTCFGDTDEDGFMEVVDAWGEPMLWLLVQVDVSNPTTTDEKYIDLPTDWTARQANGMPVGYRVLDSTISRDIQQIRATVYSQRLNQLGIYNSD